MNKNDIEPLHFGFLNQIEMETPNKYKLNNENLIIIGHVRDETIYFFDKLTPKTTIILLSEPKCYSIKKIFLELCNEYGIEVIDLREKECFNTNYKLPKRIVNIISSIILNNTFKNIFIHPLFTLESDIQNRLLTQLVSSLSSKKKLNIKSYKKALTNKKLSKIQDSILKLYVRTLDDNGHLDNNIYDNYYSIASSINF
jgi:hypothetical protein